MRHELRAAASAKPVADKPHLFVRVRGYSVRDKLERVKRVGGHGDPGKSLLDDGASSCPIWDAAPKAFCRVFVSTASQMGQRILRQRIERLNKPAHCRLAAPKQLSQGSHGGPFPPG
jgi:hypothetical protein